jgi:large subunit ribosomal protein L29
MSKKADFVKSIKDLNEKDLAARINEDEQRLKKLQFAHAISPLENPMSIRAIRKDLARMKTELKRKKTEEKTENA